jgi:cell division protein FtsB
LYSKVTIVALAILLLVLVRPTWRIFMKSLESKDNLEQAETELADLESRKHELVRDVAYLNTDHGRDQEIRSKFGVAREGETMVVIVRNDTEMKPAEPLPEPGFFRKIWSGFLGIFGVE